MFSLFARTNARAVGFLEHYRGSFVPWVLAATGGRGATPVATFLPAMHGRADAWIAKAQKAGRAVMVLMAEPVAPVNARVLVRADLRATRHFGVKLAASQRSALDAFRPAPFLVAAAGPHLYAGWRLVTPVAEIEAVEATAKAVAARLGGVSLGHLMPVAGTRTADGHFIDLHHMLKDRLALLTDFREVTPAATQQTGVLSMRADTIKAQPILWLWPGVAPLGALTLLGGAGGVGKSQAGLNIAAITSTGGQWPTGETAEPGSILVFETEDDAATVVIPRLQAAGANMARIAIGSEAFSLADGINAMADEAKRMGDVRLVVLSPFRRFLGNSENVGTLAVRNALAPLLTWATENRVAILGIVHPLKGKEHLPGFAGDPALVEVARAAWSIIPDPADRNPIPKHRRRIVVAAKSNLSADSLTLSYRIETVILPDGVETSRVVWQREAADPRTLPAQTPKPKPKPKPRLVEGEPEPAARLPAKVTRLPANAVTWLRLALAAGPRDAVELKQEAFAAGISKGGLDRAANTLGVRKEGGGAFKVRTWHLT